MRNTIRKFRRPAFFIALFLTGSLLLALPFFRLPVDVPFFFLLLGRLHPLILHFPIVLIILALFFEMARHYNFLKIGDSVMIAILIVAAMSTIFSVGAGFFLFASGEYAGNLMEQHFWAGTFTGTAILATVAFFFLYRRAVRFYPLYFASLLISNVAVGYTSHLGGSITHGKDYLTEHMLLIINKGERSRAKPESEMLVYEDMIAPIFEAKCLSCHNTQKEKGGLLMTSYQNLLRSGESGQPSVSPGLPEKSELFNRVSLPDNHKDHMPPEGKTPLSDDEKTLLKFWIKSGATEQLLVSEARKEKESAQVIEHLLPELAKYRRKVEINNIKMKAMQRELDGLAERLSISIQFDSVNEGGYFAIAMKFPPVPFTNIHFRELSPYYEVFSKVSLTSSDIDDAGLYYIGQMVNLKELYLQKTGLDGSGLVYLQNLQNLEILNLSFTKVDDKAAIDLLRIPNLKEVYLYRTSTSKEVIVALGKNRPGLKILSEEGPYF